MTSGSLSLSAESTIATIWVSLRQESGKSGRMGRSIRREVRISFSEGRPSRLKKPPLACLEILPVSRISGRPPTSTETWCGAGICVFSDMNHFLWRRDHAEHFHLPSQGEQPCGRSLKERRRAVYARRRNDPITPREMPAEVRPDA